MVQNLSVAVETTANWSNECLVEIDKLLVLWQLVELVTRANWSIR